MTNCPMKKTIPDETINSTMKRNQPNSRAPKDGVKGFVDVILSFPFSLLDHRSFQLK